MKNICSYIRKRKQIFMIIFAVFLLITMFFTFENKKYLGVYVNYEKADKKLISLVEEETSRVFKEKTIIEEKYIQAIFENSDGSYQSFFIDVKNGELLGIEDIVKEERQNDFKNKIKELISLKYPKFIADVLNYGNGKITYILKETELTIYFYDFTISPTPNEELFLNVDYHEIKNDLNFKVNLKEEYENENGMHYDPKKKTVALTFDDGPNNEKTLKLVEILKNNKMHATFFMVGNRMANAPNVLEEVLKAGNEIGSHSYNHVNLTRLKKEELLEEEKKTNEIYKSITGKDLNLLRAPYGSLNNMMKENLNYSFINWNLDTEDWRYRDENHVYKAVIDHVEDGDIILMHDLYDSTIQAVEKILPELYVKGFQVVSVTELASLKGINLESHKVYRSIK